MMVEGLCSTLCCVPVELISGFKGPVFASHALVNMDIDYCNAIFMGLCLNSFLQLIQLEPEEFPVADQLEPAADSEFSSTSNLGHL